MDYIQKTYKFKLNPTVAQTKKIDEWIGICRFVYNLALETKLSAWNAHQVYVCHYTLSRQVTDLRNSTEWMKPVPRESLECVIERLDKAYQKFFKGAGHPLFQKRGRYSSIMFKRSKVTSDRIILPKIGAIKYFNSREVKGKTTRATIKKEFDGYYVSILTRQERDTQPHPNHDSQVGIDMGVAFFASLSTGEQIENMRFSAKYAKRLRVEQRSLDRKVKGSSNWYKQKRRVEAVHSKIRRGRLDFQHKLSSKLVVKYGLISVEHLELKNMVKLHALALSINDVAWGMFSNQLAYKSDWANGKFVQVNARYTSQTCNDCGSVDKKSRISQSKFVCTECGAESNADINAAKNILARAIANVR